MKIAVYSDHMEEISLEAMLLGETPSSGSLSSVNALTMLGGEHEVVVFHRLMAPPSINILGIEWVRVDSGVGFIEQTTSQKSNPFELAIIRNHGDVFNICAALWRSGLKSVVMLNNDMAPKSMQMLLKEGVERFAVRSIRSVEYYKYMPFAARVHLVRHAVPFHFQYPNDEPCRVPGRVLWVGATRAEKGFHLLLRAWPEVKRRHSNAELHVFGSIRLHVPDAEVGWTGVMTPAFEKQYLEGIARNTDDLQTAGIILHGARPKKEIFDFALSSVAGVVNPNVYSATETFCMSAIEIQAAGCPCIGGRAGGLLETIDDGRSGTLVATEQPGELAGAILKYLNMPEHGLENSTRARSHARKFLDLEEEAKSWRELIVHIEERTPNNQIHAGILPKFVRASGSLTLCKVAGKLDRLFAKS